MDLIHKTIEGFTREWKDFSNNYKNQNDRINTLENNFNNTIKQEEKMSNFLEIGMAEITDHKDGLVNFIKGRNIEEVKSLSIDQADRGGFAVTAERYKDIISKITEISPMRQLASVDTISTNSLEILIQDGEFDCGWVAERAARDESNAPKLAQKKIMVHEIYAQPKATQRLLDDSFVNIENWITEQLVQSFAKKENTAFISGDGNDKPKGILSYDTIQRVDAEANDAVTVNDILKLINSLDETYQKNASFLMNRRTLATIQNITDSLGRNIWQGSISEKLPDTIFGIPVFCSSDMPTIAENASVIALADFKETYKIVDRHGIMVMKDPYTEKPFTKFYATKRVGGEVINQEAIKFLKM